MFIRLADKNAAFVVLHVYTPTVNFKSNNQGVNEEQTFSFSLKVFEIDLHFPGIIEIFFRLIDILKSIWTNDSITSRQIKQI